MSNAGSTGQLQLPMPLLPQAFGLSGDQPSDVDLGDPQAVNAAVAQMLARAGLVRNSDGTISIKDAGEAKSAAQANDVKEVQESKATRVNADQVTGNMTERLPPPRAPRVELTDELKRGAESFAHNFDRSLGEGLASLSAAATAAGAANQPATPGAPPPAANGAEAASVVSPAEQAMLDLKKLTADVLMAVFLKLNVNNPNDSVETHNALFEMMTTLKQEAIKDERAKIEQARKAQEKADKYADKASALGSVVQTVLLALTIALAFLTGGLLLAVIAIALAAVGAMIGKQQGGEDGAMQGASIGASLATFGAGFFINTGTQAAKVAAEETVRQAITEAVKEASKKGTKQAVAKTIQQATEKIMKEFGEKASREAVENAVRTAVEQGVAKTAEQGVTGAATTQIAEGVINEATKSVMQAVGDHVLVNPNMMTGGFVTEQFANNVNLFAQVSGSVGVAGANYKAVNMQTDARSKENRAKIYAMLAQMFQDQIEEEGEIVKMVMESKNRTVERVIEMLQAMFAGGTKVLSAQMSAR